MTILTKLEQELVRRGIKHYRKGDKIQLSCIAPDHEDNNPSMVATEDGRAYCWACGFQQNLLLYFNIAETSEIRNEDSILQKTCDRLGDEIRKLLNNYGVTAPIVNALGSFSPYPTSWRGISHKTLKNFGAFMVDKLTDSNGKDHNFEDRIVFPITDIFGNVVSYIGRYTYSDAKPKWRFFPGGVDAPLYPANVTPINNSIILVEGMGDMINLHDKGLTNAVCVFGGAFMNAKTTDVLLDKLAPYSALIDTIYILFDNDEAGIKAVNNTINKLENDFNVRNATELLEEGTDPGDLNQEQVTLLRKMIYEKGSLN